MTHATITIHLPRHRSKSLSSEGDTAEAQAAYDGNIGDYMRFLSDAATKAELGFALTLNSDEQNLDSVYSISAPDRAIMTAAHDWLHGQPDLWNWIP